MAVVVPEFDPATPKEIVEALVDTFDFTLPGRGGKTLALDLVTAAAAGIAQRSAAGKDPEGVDWRPNEPRYAAYKRNRYNVDRPGELGGQMLSLTALEGQPRIARDEIEMVYGDGVEPPPTSRSGTPLHPWEREANDREKGDYFTASGRRFYELDEPISEAMVKLVQQALDDYIEAAGY